MGENRLCLGCMENKGEALICPHCGYRENTPFSADYLAPGTILNERYLVGRMIRSNGEGATYIAFDKVISCKVFVREFMPTTLCRRSVSGAMIGSLPNKLPQYKALMAEFSELYKSMARKLRSVNHINRVIDVFFENNTSYAVSEYFDGMDFVEYLKQSTGDISWEQVKKLFAPLFTSLGIVHNAGIIHRGISPETLYVTSRGELKLIGFGTSSVRTKGTELEPELFDGYTAPEQYSPLNRQGTRTDVYGICAVIYRALTGCRPAGAEDRMINDDLCPPDNVNDEIPENVSEVIMRGMAVSGDERIGDITTLVTELFETDKEKLRQAIRTALSSAASYGEFAAVLLQQGVTVKESRGRLSYLTPDRTKPITARKLGDDFDRAAVLALLEQNAHRAAEQTATVPEYPRNIRERLQGKKAVQTTPEKDGIQRMVDRAAKRAEGKGAGYDRWAAVHNLKQMAATVAAYGQYGYSPEELDAALVSANADLQDSTAKLKALDAAIREKKELQTQVLAYAKTKPARDGLKAQKTEKARSAYRERHESDFIIADAATRYFRAHGVSKLPSHKALQAEIEQLTAEKNAHYNEYREKKARVKELHTVKSNLSQILQGEKDREKKHEHER